MLAEFTGPQAKPRAADNLGVALGSSPAGVTWMPGPHLVLPPVLLPLLLHPLLELQLLRQQHTLMCLPQAHGLLEVAEEV